tara:strand:+ start:597 stop:1862 length:1266 start_codon:yes stop_codon:yes gene_type:complete
MGIAKEIGYFNTFIIKPGPNTPGGSTTDRKFHIEESRIKGGFNNQSMELATRAFATDENYAERRRKNALIYSGIYNSKTGINKLNEFSIGKSNTKAVDSSQGSIQKLHAEDTNLLIFQEDKVSRALIDKDAVFTAEGSSIKSLSNIVIGQVIPFLGRYGISKNPESFAIKGGMKYFADKKRGVVVRLTRDGHTEISYYGMRSWFKDNLKTADKVIGIYDNVKDQYVLSLQNDSTYYTLGYDESSKGWTSFYTYKPNAGFTLKNILYTFNGPNIYKHYQTTNYNNFYNVSNTSKVNLILNNTPSAVKIFKNLSYEGSTGWKVNNIKTDTDDSLYTDKAYDIASYNSSLDYDLPGIQSFNKKENKYMSYLQNNSDIDENEVIFGEAISGIKGMYMSSIFETQTAETSKKELFAVSSETVLSSN